jgi:hypothetical protein
MSQGVFELLRALEAATGSDRRLDAELADLVGAPSPAPDYTASVDRCVELVRAELAGWAWHVGWDASGVLPYATLHGGPHLVEAAGPTVPIALLRALLRARIALDRCSAQGSDQEQGTHPARE